MVQRQTLEQRIRDGQAQRRLWIEEDAFPNPLLHSWCNAMLELDYSQGDRQMHRRLVSWLKDHDGCYHGKCVAKE